MSNGFNKKLGDILGKMDEKVLEAKLNSALDMIKNGKQDEIAKKIAKIDKDEMLAKLNELDDNKLKEMNIDKRELKKKIQDVDLNSFQKMLGENGAEIITRLKDIIN
jgi:hypothetical protein